MKKNKIIIFPGNFLPNIGGLETHVDEFVKFMPKNKYEITIFAPNANNGKEKEIIYSIVKVLRYPAFYIVPNFPFPKFWTIKFWNMFFSLYHNHYDIVMTRTRFFANSGLGMFFAKFRFNKIKLIHVEHGSEFVMLESKLSTKIAYLYDMTIGKLVFMLSDKIIAISKVSKEFVCKNFINCKKKHVPIIKRGLDFKPYEKIKLDNDIEEKFKNKIKFVVVGRLFKWKGIENSIIAYQNLPENIKKKSVFLIAGYGEDYERLKIKAGNELDKNIFFLGKVEFERAIAILKASDIYIHSSYPGGALSNSLLQAMHSECAIIASPNEGANEVIINNENGILLNSNNPKKIQQSMEILFKDIKLKTKLSFNAKITIEEDFNWESVIEKYEKEINELIINNQF